MVLAICIWCWMLRTDNWKISQYYFQICIKINIYTLENQVDKEKQENCVQESCQSQLKWWIFLQEQSFFLINNVLGELNFWHWASFVLIALGVKLWGAVVLEILQRAKMNQVNFFFFANKRIYILTSISICVRMNKTSIPSCIILFRDVKKFHSTKYPLLIIM